MRYTQIQYFLHLDGEILFQTKHDEFDPLKIESNFFSIHSVVSFVKCIEVFRNGLRVYWPPYKLCALRSLKRSIK